jgi:hypothetical protein
MSLLHHHCEAVGTIRALLELVADGPEKGRIVYGEFSSRSDSDRLGSAVSERVVGRADLRWVAGPSWWASCAWCLHVGSGRC